MSTLWKRHQTAEWNRTANKTWIGRFAWRRSAKLTALALSLTVACCCVVRAQNLKRDPGAQNVQQTNDVTGGLHYLLRNDDMVMLQVNKVGSTLATSLVTLDTSNSQVSGTQTIAVNTTNPNGVFNPSGGILAAQGIGRMYNTRSDTIAVLNEADGAGGTNWSLSLLDPLTKFQFSLPLNTRFRPYGQVFTQVVMGDFNGDGLSDPLVFYSSVYESQPEWGMQVLTATDPKTEAAPTEGPELYGNTEPVPVAGSIVAGDFNNDGIDEIAALLTDYQTIAFYKVDPTTLVIAKTGSVKLPSPMVPGQATLAEGRFRDCGGNCQTNADLAVVGQINHQTFGYSVIPIIITPTSGGAFTAQVVEQQNSQQPFFRFPDRHGSYGVMAQAAPLVYGPQQTFQQLVIGIQTKDGAGYIDIGSFAQDNKLDTFNWESDTELRAGLVTLLQNMWVGNFDNLDADGKTHDPAWQIETYTIEQNIFFLVPHIRIFDVNAPPPPPPNPLKPGDWLKQHKNSDFTNIPNASSLLVGVVVPGDLQGRSLRLGAPTIVRIPTQIQPDIVLAVPPMHIDWIAPNTDINNLDQPGCISQYTPCLVNLTVLPSMPAPGVGFSTSFSFTSNSSSQGKQSSTTSWGVSVKETTETSATFNDGLEGASLDVKNTAAYAHDHTVKHTYDTYQGQTNSLSATTGFADHLFFTIKGMNVYYYPVLGLLGCASDPLCPDNSKLPAYVEYSVPDQVTHADMDGTALEWYQPVHEPGNVFSYPWSEAQLEAQFADSVAPLTQDPVCQATDSSTDTYSTTWNSGTSQSNSAGTTNSFSDDVSMSYSETAGVSGVDAASFKFGLDIAANTSLNTLNENTSSLSVSNGITVNQPEFTLPGGCCTYNYGAYIFGLKNKKHTPGQDLTVNDPDGKPVDITSPGPLFVGFLADMAPDSNGLNCTGGTAPWWSTVYNKPDVGVNHPDRWTWHKATQTAAFNQPDPDLSPLDQAFYQMKGFFVTKAGDLVTGPNLAEAQAGDQLTLSSRVYNYSMVDTTAPVYVRFYGQFYCRSGDGSEASCRNGNNPVCAPQSLCGNSFAIGQSQIATIPGFKSTSGGVNPNANVPNWTTTSVNFDTTPYGSADTNMVFWVVAWMQDANGNLVAEMPDHGLTANPTSSNFPQITNVPIQAHSNNIGMYGINQPFEILPKNTLLGASQSGGSLRSITLSANPHILLEQRTKLTASLQASGAPVKSVNIAYYDGNPAKHGKLLDVQKIPHMNPGLIYQHRTFFTPESCGVHTLFVAAWIADMPEIGAKAVTHVTVRAADLTQVLIAATEKSRIGNARLRSNLLALLNTALLAFEQNQTQAGEKALSSYMQALAAASGKGISVRRANQLIGQAGVLFGCAPSHFPLPATAVASAGTQHPTRLPPRGAADSRLLLPLTAAERR